MTAPAPFQIHTGDCLDVLRAMEPESVDAIVCDPPAGIGFMNANGWDRDRGGRDAWVAWMSERAAAALAAAKPGAHALIWALPRTSHWTATAWEDAGWEVRDRVSHLFGTGFPKSHNVGKAIDKMKGAEREVVGPGRWNHVKGSNEAQADCLIRPGGKHDETAPATPEAAEWEGWGSALKPAVEDWWLLRKPLAVDGKRATIAANVLAHGTGALNVDACRVGTEGATSRSHQEPYGAGGRADQGGTQAWRTGHSIVPVAKGRWPAHLVHDGSPEVREAFERFGETGAAAPASGPKHSGASTRNAMAGDFGGMGARAPQFHGDTGTAARFFSPLGFAPGEEEDALRFMYCPKASKAEREAGLTDWPEPRANPYGEGREGKGKTGHYQKRRNTHPTVKPRALMAWLCRLVTPPGGTVLDPFTGSGSTGVACMAEGFRFVGIEQSPEYADIARARIAHALAETAAPAPAAPSGDGRPGPAPTLSLFPETA